MSAEDQRRGQERGMWTSGLFLATFGPVGAGLMLGLVQRWGEVFPRWMIGLAGRRVPSALAVATWGYYDRRRGLCRVCGQGASGAPSSAAPSESAVLKQAAYRG
jgi:hypothetical protein